MRKMELNEIGIMYPDYLTDHHNREGELLLCVPVTREMKILTIEQELKEDLNSLSQTKPDKWFSDAIEAIREWFDDLMEDKLIQLFPRFEWEDTSEENLEMGMDLPYWYFYLEWEPIKYLNENEEMIFDMGIAYFSNRKMIEEEINIFIERMIRAFADYGDSVNWDIIRKKLIWYKEENL